MINIFPNAKKKQHGAALLVFTFVLLLIITWLSFMMAKTGQLSQKISASDYRAEQAFEAAEAGLEFGIVYLGKNQSAIIQDADSDGNIDNYTSTSTSNVTLSNGSKYSITYTNPTPNDFSIIQVRSVGSSADGIASREVRVLVKFSPTLVNFGDYPLVALGDVSLGGSSQVYNTETDTTVQAGGDVSINGGAETVIGSGTSSTSSSTESDVDQNNTSLLALTPESFFSEYFGTTAARIKSSANYVYENSTDTNYNTALNGKESVLIWVEQTGGTTATINSTTTVGSATHPVILIVNGDLKIVGSAHIYGYVFVTGSLDTAGAAGIDGGIAVGDDASTLGNFTITFNSTILDETQQSMGIYGKIPGSWNDLKH